MHLPLQTPRGSSTKTSVSRLKLAAEKALKAVFVARKIPYPYTHDINALLSGLEQHHIGIPGPLWDAVTLTSFASDTRYPGTTSPITNAEYEEAIRLASVVISWAENQVG